MKVITVIQPWATLIAIGEKKFETRSWATKYRGVLAIHAGKKIDKAACRREPIRSVLANHGYDETNLPTGVILALGCLHECWPVMYDLSDPAWIGFERVERDEQAVSVSAVRGNEYHFGDYSPGRFAWELSAVTRLSKPIPAKGQLSLWNWEG
ncbi:2-oxoglutarate dehydrogenase E1 [Cohnella kolymensis]|uniref:2-oxoglutarate dehydrogenase E1 n=1 Tax=Cohnella kolymensis TaxID=1590652 RepID=A0ABR5A246_9BACL|nr:ASCH domain-containing protein [Cohnella kolymensis]KIL35147.1 2-oxoglutarate dehydrogenase E1 [Cohnella kolymensis]